MSDLSGSDRRKLEEAFGMSTGYVLNFSNRTFEDFIDEAVGIKVYDDMWAVEGGSKANRLRAIWKREPNYAVAILLDALLKYWRELHTDKSGALEDGFNLHLYEQCSGITDRLRQSSTTSSLDQIPAFNEDRNFGVLHADIRSAIERGHPEAAIDRLHTFLLKYIRSLCAKHKLPTAREEALHSVFGKYVKTIDGQGLIQSEMARRILKSNISVLESFNIVRNDHSLAHDNEVLGKAESLMILESVSALIEFITSLEESIRSIQPTQHEDVLPF